MMKIKIVIKRWAFGLKARSLCPSAKDVWRRHVGVKSRLKAERAWFLSVERRAKPETEQLLLRWGKSCVFLNPLPELYFIRPSSPYTHACLSLSRKKRCLLF
ncbi:MAG: hypothetical protein ACETWK_05870 [Candidatus Aminicenantaceae bacterium]